MLLLVVVSKHNAFTYNKEEENPLEIFFRNCQRQKLPLHPPVMIFFCPAHIWGNGERGVGGLCEKVQQRNELLSLSSLSIVGSNSGVFERFISRVYVYVYRFLFLFLFLWHNPQKITLSYFHRFPFLSQIRQIIARPLPKSDTHFPPSFSHALPTGGGGGDTALKPPHGKKGRGKRECVV